MSFYYSGMPHPQQDPAQMHTDLRPIMLTTNNPPIIQQQQYGYPPTGYPQSQSQPSNASHQAPIVDLVVQNVLTALRPILTNNHEQSMERTKKLEGLITMARDEAKAHTSQVVEQLEDSHKKRTRALLKHIDKLEKMIGTPPGDESLMGVLSSFRFDVGEFLERADDMEARLSLPAMVQRAVATVKQPKKQYTDVGVNTLASTPLPPRPPRLQHLFSNNSETTLSPGPASEATDPSNANRANPASECTIDTIDHATTHALVERPALRVRAHFTSAPPIPEQPLVPVDWSKIVNGQDPTHQTGSESLSPTTSSKFSLLRSPSPDGTIASLRRATLGDALASPAAHSVPMTFAQHIGLPPTQFPLSPPDSQGPMSTSPVIAHMESSNEQLDSVMGANVNVNVKSERTISGTMVPSLVDLGLEGSLSPLTSDDDDVEVTVKAELEAASPSFKTLRKRKSTGSQHARAKKKVKKVTEVVSKAGSSTRPQVGCVKRDVGAGGECGKWPEKIMGDEVFSRQLVKCDDCGYWYHYSCGAIVGNDPRIEPGNKYRCPPCVAVVADSPRLWTIRRRKKGICRRPDCDILDTGFVVKRLIGRMCQQNALGEVITDVKSPTREPLYYWLVRWDGYTVQEATWEGKESFGEDVVVKLVRDFEDAARMEGRGDRLDAKETVLLGEALNGGWKPM